MAPDILEVSYQVSQERQFMQRERFFVPRTVPAIEEVINLLRCEGATGTLSIDLASGGVCCVRFSERKRVE